MSQAKIKCKKVIQPNQINCLSCIFNAWKVRLIIRCRRIVLNVPFLLAPRAPAARSTGRGPPSNSSSNNAANAQIEDLSTQLMESKLTIEGLEKERDFYFGKLRDIEVLAQEYESAGGEFVEKALQVLYATEVRVFF